MCCTQQVPILQGKKFTMFRKYLFFLTFIPRHNIQMQYLSHQILHVVPFSWAFFPYKCCWALPGEIIRESNEGAIIIAHLEIIAVQTPSAFISVIPSVFHSSLCSGLLKKSFPQKSTLFGYIFSMC